MITVTQATQILREHSTDWGTEQVPLHQATGRVLAEKLFADTDLPPFHRVMMDGIAIRWEDLNANDSFKIVGVCSAGLQQQFSAKEGECVEIMTGAALPESFDTVVPYEHIQIANDIAKIESRPTKQFQNIHLKGSDFKEGAELALQNKKINAAIIGIAASIGKQTLLVKKLPRIIIISTGDELVSIDKTPLAGQIRQSNAWALLSLLQTNGLNAEIAHLPDELEAVISQLDLHQKNNDIILMSGGVSKGKFDYIARALEQLNCKTLFHRIAQKPGKPMLFGKLNDTFVFGFPGNPVSTLVCACKYFIPWLQTNLGIASVTPQATLQSDVTIKSNLTFFLPVIIQVKEGNIHAHPAPNNGSGDFASLAVMDAWLEIPENSKEIKKGFIGHLIPLNPLQHQYTPY
jgi:molybdopterin molybdotransferase